MWECPVRWLAQYGRSDLLRKTSHPDSNRFNLEEIESKKECLSVKRGVQEASGGLILDIRDNPGGVVLSGYQIAQLLLPPGTLHLNNLCHALLTSLKLNMVLPWCSKLCKLPVNCPGAPFCFVEDGRGTSEDVRLDGDSAGPLATGPLVLLLFPCLWLTCKNFSCLFVAQVHYDTAAGRYGSL